jgi:hypothetical protein
MNFIIFQVPHRRSRDLNGEKAQLNDSITFGEHHHHHVTLLINNNANNRINHYDPGGGSSSYIDYANIVIATQYIGPIYTTQQVGSGLGPTCAEVSSNGSKFVPMRPIQPGDGAVVITLMFTPRENDSGVSFTLIQNALNPSACRCVGRVTLD